LKRFYVFLTGLIFQADVIQDTVPCLVLDWYLLRGCLGLAKVEDGLNPYQAPIKINATHKVSANKKA
jgi:hypothetical protein